MKIIFFISMLSISIFAQPNLLFLMGDQSIEQISSNLFLQSYTGSRSDLTGVVGFEFEPNEDIVIVKLGRSISTAMADNHKVQIWRVSDQSLITTATITPSSVVDSLGYAIENIDAVTLFSGVTYRVVSTETNGGDLWKDSGDISNHSNKISIIRACYGITPDGYPTDVVGGVDVGYVPPTFYIVE